MKGGRVRHDSFHDKNATSLITSEHDEQNKNLLFINTV